MMTTASDITDKETVTKTFGITLKKTKCSKTLTGNNDLSMKFLKPDSYEHDSYNHVYGTKPRRKSVNDLVKKFNDKVLNDDLGVRKSNRDMNLTVAVDEESVRVRNPQEHPAVAGVREDVRAKTGGRGLQIQVKSGNNICDINLGENDSQTKLESGKKNEGGRGFQPKPGCSTDPGLDLTVDSNLSDSFISPRAPRGRISPTNFKPNMTVDFVPTNGGRGFTSAMK